MATKAELEAELKQLRAELAERDASLEAKETSEVKPEPESKMDDEPVSLEADIGELLAELEEFPNKQPLMFALGAFVVGYLIGRMKWSRTMSNRISRNISIILRSERLIAQRHLAVLRRQTGLMVMALVVAGIGLVMLNLAGFFALEEVMTPASAALIVGVVNIVLAGLFVSLASSKSGIEEDITAVTEVRDMAIEDLEAEVRQAADEAKSAVDAVKAMAANPLGGIAPSVAAGIAKAVVKPMKTKE
eukprot:CAMPEP_0184441852 /NCGR_PEP_ID=MMETSP0738-20130409/756289_1 /TAXON_ID=385413 /ORGANISM="Thalassiosira miniscula, Strain CCMP1093" /LENGTH=246 /DNA_ID=CAMNT_0026809779 /DNA_START=1651 /DNA_END=2392 /DNA_ORIENTATION=-